MKVIQLSGNSQIKVADAKTEMIGNYNQYEFTVASKSFTPEITPLSILSGSERLRASVKSVNAAINCITKSLLKNLTWIILLPSSQQN